MGEGLFWRGTSPCIAEVQLPDFAAGFFAAGGWLNGDAAGFAVALSFFGFFGSRPLRF
jgi:hypothetical protein